MMKGAHQRESSEGKIRKCKILSFFFSNATKFSFEITCLKPLLNLIKAVNEHQACIVFSPGAAAIGFYSGCEIAASSAGALLLIFSGASG